MKREIEDLRYGRSEEENRAKIDIVTKNAPAKCVWTSIFSFYLYLVSGTQRKSTVFRRLSKGNNVSNDEIL